MQHTSLKSFIRSGGGRAFHLALSPRSAISLKQADAGARAGAERLVAAAWDRLSAATTRDILRAEPVELARGDLASLDPETIRSDALNHVLTMVERDGLNLDTAEGRQRALMALAGFLNEAQQTALQVQFYVWITQNDNRVRGTHAERSQRIFR
jgi:hypothetical protein